MKSTLAYIDDNQHNLDFIGHIMATDFEVKTYQSAEPFLEDYPSCHFDTIIIDVHMPTMDGFTLYEKIIKAPDYNGCPIIFISSDDSDSNRIKSFSLGAVEFLNRHMKPDEIVSRVKSKILFFKKHRCVTEFGDLKLNLTLLKAFLNEEELKLTFIEFKLLCQLVRHYPDTISKEELAEKVWCHEMVLDATIYTHIFNLNSKLNKWDHEIGIERNQGAFLRKKTEGP